jgi:hypothetical protein
MTNCFSLHGRLYGLVVSMENFGCLFVSTETFVLSWSPGIHLHENVHYFRSNAPVSKSLQLPFVSMDTFNTQ